MSRTTGSFRADGPFSVGEARHVVKDLFRPSPWIYWTDFLTSWGIGLFCFWFIPRASQFAAEPTARIGLQALAFAICVLLFYRCSTFTHELVHLKGIEFRIFSVVWNLLCGIPFLMPSFTYHTHVRHHYRKLYATPGDGEYLALAFGPRWKIPLYVAESFVVPIAAIVRFGLLVPLTWFSSRLRSFVHARMSSMVIDPLFVRPRPTRREAWLWRVQEAATFAYIVAVIVKLSNGSVPWDFPLRAYAVGVAIMLLNSLRTLGAHRYWLARREATFLEQLLDSVNYPRESWLAELWAPVGLRYHALHHLFPSMPYHNLGVAHSRLLERLPSDSLYRETLSPSLRASIADLWHRAGDPSALSTLAITRHLKPRLPAVALGSPHGERIDASAAMIHDKGDSHPHREISSLA